MFSVQITKAAEDDIAAIIDYLLAQDAGDVAAELWGNFEEAFRTLRTFPLRGHMPPELAEYPDKRIKEIHVSVHRLIYRVIQEDVSILFIVDGRRNITKALLDRALRFGL